MSTTRGLIEKPLEKFETGGAKAGLFSIGILNTDGGMHDTKSITTMSKAQAMTQLVQSGLFYSRH